MQTITQPHAPGDCRAVLLPNAAGCRSDHPPAESIYPPSGPPLYRATGEMMKVNATASGVAAPGLRFIVYLKFMD